MPVNKKEQKNHNNKSVSRSSRLLAWLLAVMLILGSFSAIIYGVWGGDAQAAQVEGSVSFPQMESPVFMPRTNVDSGMAAYFATAVVTGNTVNVRSGPSSKYSVLGTVRKGAKLNVKGKFSNNWYKIEFKNGFGYITGQYLGSFQAENTDVDKEMTVVSGTAVVKESLNVRKGPATTYSKLAVLAKGTRVELLGKFANNWYKIKYSGGTGYVSGDYLAVTEQTTNQTTTTKPTTTTTKPTTTLPTTTAPGVDSGMTVVSGTATVTEPLNIRKGPATTYNKITVMPKGTVVELLGRFSNNWYKIRYGNIIGYVSGDYLKVSVVTTTTTKPTTTTTKPTTTTTKSTTTTTKPTTTTTKPTTTPTTKPTTTAPGIDSGIINVQGRAVTTDALSVRKGPATTYGRLTVLDKGTTVDFVGKFSNNWYKIKYGSGYAYVCGDYLKISQTTTTTAKHEDDVQTMDRYGVTTARLNVRKGPGTKYDVVTVAPVGSRLHITGKTADGWYRIAYGSVQAYVSADYVKLESETATTTTRPVTTTTKPTTTATTATTKPTTTTTTQPETTLPQTDVDKGMLPAKGTASVTVDLNVRSGPATSYDKIGSVPNGTTVSLLGRFRVGNTYWYKINFGGGAGYVSGDYMKAFNIKLDASGGKAQSGELRGVWLSYIELNFATGWDNEKICNTKVTEMFDKAAADGMNAVFVHVRPFSDAYYKSDYFPWSAYVTGTQGDVPAFDPLQIMIDEAHKRGLELHAWINPYRVSTSGTDIKRLAENNPARVWLEANPNDTRVIKWGKGLYYNPASEDVRKLIVNGVDEIVRNYDVDGIHFDDYFYPTTDASIDAADYKNYKSAGGTMTLKQWRTDNVDRMVKSCYDAVKSVNPSVAFGISPQGNIMNNTDELYADVYKWGAEGGYVDYLAPQIYFGFNHWLAAFDKWTDDWIDLVSNPNVKLYIGLGAYRIGTNQGGLPAQQQEWIKNTDNLKRQLEYMRWTGGCDGFILFSYNSLWGADVNAYSEEELKNLLSVL